MSANSIFQASSGIKKPYFRRRGSSWYKQGRLGRPPLLDAADPKNQAKTRQRCILAAALLASDNSFVGRRGRSHYLCNLAAAACKWVLQQMGEEAEEGGRGGDATGEGGARAVDGDINWPSSNRAKRML